MKTDMGVNLICIQFNHYSTVGVKHWPNHYSSDFPKVLKQG